MATITASSISAAGANDVTTVTLDGSSDTFTYTAGAILVMHNPTGAPITATIDGGSATTASLPGVGSIDISGGYSTGAIAAGDTIAIQLDSIRQYLAGTIAIGSGTGLECQLLLTQ